MKSEIKSIFLFGLIAMLFSACGATSEKVTGGSESGGGKPKAGEMVLFKSGPVNYAEGKVEKVEAGKYEIRSKDSIAKPDASDVYALPKAGAKPDLKPGDMVVAFNYEIYWEGGEVKNVTGDVIEVEKASGGKLTVAPDKIVKVSPAAVSVIKQAIEAKAFEDTGKTRKPVLPKDWKPKEGEKVAAQWSFGSWHVAVIKHVNANNIDIDWQNGWSDATIDKEKIAPYPTAANAMPVVNAYVIVKPQTDTQEWKFAVVTAVNGHEVEAKFSDGKTRKIRNTDFIAMS